MSADDFRDSVPLVEQGRFPYFIEGKITNINDDAGLGRVKVRLKGMEDGDETDWLAPAWPGSIEAVPNVDELVWVQFIEGDPAHGLYLWFPTKNTRNRPVEAMVLGSTAWGMLNFMVTQLNQLRTDHNTFVTTIYNLHNHPTAAIGPVSVPSVVGTSTTAVAVNKGKAADGSVVADKSTSEIVLSGKARLR